MKTVYCYISHIITDQIIKNFLNIKKSINNKTADIVFVLTQGHYDHIDEYLNNKHINLHLDNVDLVDTINYKCIHNHIIFKGIKEQLPNYDQYWIIEYDISINNKNKISGYKNLFKFYEDDTSDLLCSHLTYWKENKYYQKRYNIELLNSYKQFKDSFLYKDNKIIEDYLTFAFMPICKISNRLFNKMIEYYNEYGNGFFEYVIPSIANFYNMTIRTFTDDGFVIEKPINIKLKSPEHSINKGSSGWNNKGYKEYFNKYPKNVIIHPNKNKYLKPKDTAVWVCCLTNNLKHYKNIFYYNFVNQNNPTKSELKKENIFYLNKFLSEYTLQYYVWKNNIKSKYICFCHENKIIKPTAIHQNKVTSNNIQSFAILPNNWAAECTPENNNFICECMRYQKGWDDVIEYLNTQKYIDPTYVLSNVDKTFVQYEMFCMKWEDFCKYQKFMWGYIEFIMNKYNLDLSFESWKNHIKENYIDNIDLDNLVWFMFIGYDIYRKDVNESLSTHIRCNVWRIYSYILEILAMIYVKSIGYFIDNTNEDNLFFFNIDMNKC